MIKFTSKSGKALWINTQQVAVVCAGETAGTTEVYCTGSDEPFIVQENVDVVVRAVRGVGLVSGEVKAPTVIKIVDADGKEALLNPAMAGEVSDVASEEQPSSKEE